MIKTIPTIPKLLAMVIFALGSFSALLFLWVSFGGPVPLHAKGYRFEVLFPQAAQLARQADVRISGVTVGKVVALESGVGNRTRATIELQPRYAPIPATAKAMLRSKTLLGETFVELAPNRSAANARPLPENGSLPASAVSPTVELDQLLRAFDPNTRKAFRVWMQTQASAMAGRGQDINEALGQFPGFVDEMEQLVATLDTQGTALQRSVSGTGQVFDAISKRQGDLRGLIEASNKTFGTIGDRNQQLAAIFKNFPAFQREATETLPKVTAFADRSKPVVERLQPVATEMAPTFKAVEQLSPDLERLMKQLGPVIDASDKGLPALNRILEGVPPVLDAFDPFLQNINPLLRYLGQHQGDFTSFAANLAVASQPHEDVSNRGLTGSASALRVATTLSPEILALQQRSLGQNRSNAYVAPNGMSKLATGLESYSGASCNNGDPAPPPLEAGALDLAQFVFRTTGRDSARPGCTVQGKQPGYQTIFPQLQADAPVGTEGGAR